MNAPYQLYPDLEPAVEAALRSSIKRWGVIYPIVTDQAGRIIDGHHRSRIARELGLRPRIETRRVRNEEEARELARTLNEDRRHIPADQRREVVADLREEGHSLRAIGGALGVDKRTVQRDLDRIGAGAPMPDRVRTTDGRTYPASRPAPERPVPSGTTDEVVTGDQVSDDRTPGPSGPPEGVDPETGEIADREPDQADELVERRSDTERLLGVYSDLHEKLGRVTMQLTQLSPENVATALDGAVVDLWRGVEDSVNHEVPELDAWFRAVLKARPKPFTVVAGGRA